MRVEAESGMLLQSELRKAVASPVQLTFLNELTMAWRFLYTNCCQQE
jgi:hypothetical protein